MPAIREEVEEAEEEGVQISYLTAPIRVLSRNGAVCGLECIRMDLESQDEQGRRGAKPIPGSEFELEVDMVIPAVGEEPDLSVLPEHLAPHLEGEVIGDCWVFVGDGVFLGGDLVTGSSNVATAIGAGRKAALAIDRYLRSGREEGVSGEEGTIQFEDLNPDYFESKPRVVSPKLGVEQRAGNFKEVNLSLPPELGIQEANRCFGCGMCSGCGNCLLFCPDMAVIKDGDGYRIDYEYCKGCGICAEECPAGYISLEVQEK